MTPPMLRDRLAAGGCRAWWFCRTELHALVTGNGWWGFLLDRGIHPTQALDLWFFEPDGGLLLIVPPRRYFA